MLPEALEDVLNNKDHVELHKHAPVKTVNATGSGCEVRVARNIVMVCSQMQVKQPPTTVAWPRNITEGFRIRFRYDWPFKMSRLSDVLSVF